MHDVYNRIMFGDDDEVLPQQGIGFNSASICESNSNPFQFNLTGILSSLTSER